MPPSKIRDFIQVLILYMLLYIFQHSKTKMLSPVSNILLLFRKRPIFLIGLIMVSDHILAGRENGSKYERLYGSWMSNIFNNILVSKML